MLLPTRRQTLPFCSGRYEVWQRKNPGSASTVSRILGLAHSDWRDKKVSWAAQRYRWTEAYLQRLLFVQVSTPNIVPEPGELPLVQP